MENDQKLRFELMELPWDTEYFGMPAAKIILQKSIEKQEEKQSISQFANQFEFVAITNANNNNHNNFWVNTEFKAQLADVNIQLIKDIGHELKCVDTSVKVTNKMPFHADIVEISKQSFIESRFFNDPYLEKGKAKEIYVHWVMNSFDKENKYFVYTQEAGKITGFILFSIQKQNSTATIELIAVHQQFQNKKIGQRMLLRAEDFLFEEKIKRLKVGTQINNITAINFYTKQGFKLSECHSIYHYWPHKTN